MKKSILIIVYSIFISGMFGQHESQFGSENRHDISNLGKHGSKHIYQQFLYLSGLKNYHIRNGFEEKLDSMVYYNIPNSRDWQPGEKYTFYYDVNEYRINGYIYDWSEYSWLEEIYYEIYCDTNWNAIEQISFMPIEGNWEKFYRITYEYDEVNNIVFIYRYIWENQQWEKYLKDEYEYNNNFLTDHKRFNWENNQWISDWTVTYEFDTSGLMIRQTIQYWRNNQWELSHKYEYSYDENDIVIQSMEYRWLNNQWNIFGKEDYTNDEIGNCITLTGYSWSGKEWNESHKEEREYDNNLNIDDLLLYIYFFDQVFPEPFNHGKLTRVTSYNWDDQVDDWVPRNDDFLFFSPINLVEIKKPLDIQKKFNNYPNPSSNHTVITWGSEIDVLKVELLTIDGKLIETILPSAGSNKVEVNTEDLLQGIYLYRVIAGNQTSTGKLMVMR